MSSGSDHMAKKTDFGQLELEYYFYYFFKMSIE